ncbi:hemolysin family protein [Parafrankia elaeagni]|uniref:hemolysin family protein n=1 Tax=Parafrankia elaeagni TaxID=222534 RepID=UPI00036442DE|nr:hemolysin family protein [Parafrankia elaeagni]
MLEAAGYLLVAVLLIAGNALFVAAEFALVAVEPHQVAEDAEAGERRAGVVLGAVRSLSFQLSGAQLGITATSLAVGYLAEPAIATLLRPPLEAIGLPTAPSGLVAITLALVLATVTQMVFGELVPKNWAISEPVRVARAVAPAQVLFSRVFRPLISLLNGAANVLVRAVGVEPQDELRTGRSSEELGSIVASSAEHGTLPATTASLLSRSLRFGDRRASDVMTPRMRTVFVHADTSLAELLGLAERTGLSRFPVLRAGRDAAPRGGEAAAGDHTNTGDHTSSGDDANDGDSGNDGDSRNDGDAYDVIGVVHVKDAFRAPPAERARRGVAEFMVEPLLVPASLHCEVLLHRLRRGGLQLAVVIDEYGGMDGIVTMEDLVEELVGEVDDEHDRPASPDVVALSAGQWLLSGLLRLDEVREETGISLPEGPYETVGGLVLARLGRLGKPQDVAVVDHNELVVVAVDGRRIDRVRLVATPTAGATATATTATDRADRADHR